MINELDTNPMNPTLKRISDYVLKQKSCLEYTEKRPKNLDVSHYFDVVS